MDEQKLKELYIEGSYGQNRYADINFEKFYDGVIEMIAESDYGNHIVSSDEFILVWFIKKKIPFKLNDVHLLFKKKGAKWYEQKMWRIEQDVADYIGVKNANECLNQLRKDGIITSTAAYSDKNWSSKGMCVDREVWDKLSYSEQEAVGHTVMNYFKVVERTFIGYVYFQDSVSDKVIAKYGTFKTLKTY